MFSALTGVGHQPDLEVHLRRVAAAVVRPLPTRSSSLEPSVDAIQTSSNLGCSTVGDYPSGDVWSTPDLYRVVHAFSAVAVSVDQVARMRIEPAMGLVHLITTALLVTSSSWGWIIKAPAGKNAPHGNLSYPVVFLQTAGKSNTSGPNQTFGTVAGRTARFDARGKVLEQWPTTIGCRLTVAPRPARIGLIGSDTETLGGVEDDWRSVAGRYGRREQQEEQRRHNNDDAGRSTTQTESAHDASLPRTCGPGRARRRRVEVPVSRGYTAGQPVKVVMTVTRECLARSRRTDTLG